MKLPVRNIHAKREPLRTLVELAEEFGVPLGALCSAMKNHPGAPEPSIDGRENRNVYKAKWYSPSKMRAWWSSFDHTPCPRAEYYRQWQAARKQSKGAA